MELFNEGLFSQLLENGTISSDSWQYNAIYLLMILMSVVASYLLGSVNSAIIISKALYKEDIRNYGSGNAGLTNMLRTYGKGAAGLTLLGDMLKTAIAILFTAFLFGFSYEKGISLNEYCYLAGVAAVLGHVYPIYYGFKGGKGVLVTSTMALILAPIHFAALITVFILVLLIWGYVSLGSIIVASLFPITVCLYIVLVCTAPLHFLTAISVFFLGIFIVWCHRTNIKRLANGTEKKISIGNKNKKG